MRPFQVWLGAGIEGAEQNILNLQVRSLKAQLRDIHAFTCSVSSLAELRENEGGDSGPMIGTSDIAEYEADHPID